MTKTASSRIEEIPVQRGWTPEARWTIPQLSEEQAFLFPAFGPGTYDNVVAQVLANKERGANLPRGEQSALMLNEAYNSADDVIRKSSRTEFVRKEIMANSWLWVPHVVITTPNSIKNPGMYVVFDEEGKGLARKYTTEELEDKLLKGDTEKGVRFSQDGAVAFAPRNTYQGGEYKKGTLAQDGAFIAVYRPEGAKALDRVAEQFSWNPFSWVVDNTSNENIQTLSALGGGRLLDGWLGANFNSSGYDRGGYVISVSGSGNSAEGTASKK